MFNPNALVASGQRANYSSRPTVVAFVAVSGIGGESLLMVLPPKAKPQGWILPQGEICLQESPKQAALRILSTEYGLKSSLFQDFIPVALAEAIISARDPKGLQKHLLVVGLKCTSESIVQQNSSSKFFRAGGPNAAWEHFADCRQEKQALFVEALSAAVGHKNNQGRLAPLLNGPRWKEERLLPLYQTVG